MSEHELTQTQALTLDLLKHVIGICDRQGIRYYVGGGACIGVVRHGGFIPWDDDVDLSLPREDFERFVSFVKSHPEDGYSICDRYSDPGWHFCMCQYVDTQSEIEIDLAAEKRKAHIWIDIFPLDGLPDSDGARWMHVKHIMELRYLIQLANVRTQVDAHRQRPFIERAVIGASEALRLGEHIDSTKDMDRLDHTCKLYSFYKQKYCGNMLGRYREREVVPTAYFGEPRKALFEGFPVNIPERTDEYLTALYGDYMTLPPAEQRVAHNVRVLKARRLPDGGEES
ncbi:MAG: LicD family protein [Olsenella sp.]|jgi:lipopolysaccharide cholinephosphotransferase|nr:LicD family protein [Olsenella sp.]